MIGLTETWLNYTNYDLYGLQGYNFVEQHRSSLGGGVALCVMKHLNYLERPDLALYDNDFESVFIEVNKDKLHVEKILSLVFCIVHLGMILGHLMRNLNLYYKR